MQQDIAKPDAVPRIAGDVRIARFRTLADGTERWRISVDGLRRFLTDQPTAHRVLALTVKSDAERRISDEEAYRRYSAAYPAAESAACFVAWCEQHMQSLEALAQVHTAHSMRWRFTLLNSRTCERLARTLTPLFKPVAVYAAWGLAALAMLAYLLYAPAAQGGSAWIASLIALIGVFIHQLGHVTGCVRHGARQQGIGVGLYWIWPAFFADVRGSWVLPATGRVQVSMGGLYFQSIYVAALSVFTWATGNADTAIAIQVSFLLMATTLNPVFKYDGYWILSDVFDITNLHSRISAHLHTMLSTRGRACVERDRLRPTLVAIAFSALAVAYLGYIAHVLGPAGIATCKSILTDWHLAVASTSHEAARNWTHTGLAALELLIIGLAFLMLGAQSLRAMLRVANTGSHA